MTIAVTHSTAADSSFSATGVAAWEANHVLTGVGTMAEQNANNVNITGGSISGVTVAGVVTSVSGTAPIASSGGTTPAISIPKADASTNGYLSSTDWSTFNSKGSGTITSVSGTSPIASSGGATPAISISQAGAASDGYLSSTDWNTFNNKQPAGSYLTAVTADAPLSGAGTSASHLVIAQAGASTSGYLSSTDWNTFNNKGSGTVTSVSATSPVTSTGGATPTIAIPAANTTTDGYLSSTDWNTFNNKQPAGSYLTAVTADSPLSGAGTSASHLVIAQAGASTSGYLSSTDWNTFNNKQPAGTYVTSVGATSPVTSSGGTTPTIAIPQATSSVSGYLTNTDWSTFNNKANSGANSDITSMSGITGAISSPDYIQFDTTYATTLAAGQLGWDGNDTLGLGMIGGNVVQHIGEDLFFYCKASSAITKGQVVMFTGAVGASGVPTGAPATGITDGTYIMGIAAESIALNGFGLIQAFGEIRNVNTSGYADGDILWYDPSVTGGLTKTKPSAPNVKVQMAAVINGGSAGGGTILVRIDPGSTLGGTDSNAQITSPVSGDVLVYNGTYWLNQLGLGGGMF